MSATIVDLEEHRWKLISELPPINYSGARLSDDGEMVLLECGTGELTADAAERLGETLQELAKLVREGGR